MNEKLKLKEKLGYGAGDFASSMFWKLFSMFLPYFYTDVFELTPESVGTMFLLTRVWDSINDPLMGIISDRTNTRYGKYRPYLLWFAIPFGLIGFLTFLAPDLGSAGKLVYAYITYTLMMMVYTGINVPYSSLIGVMTSDSSERTTLATFRFIGAFSGGILVTSTAAWLIDIFKSGGATEAVGYKYTVAIYGILAALLFFLTFKWTKERVAHKAEKKSRIKDDLKDLIKNVQWLVMLGAGIAGLIFNSLRDGSIMYYFKYYILEQEVMFFGHVSWEKLASAYLTIWLATNIIGVLLTKPLANWLGKRMAFFVSTFTASAFSLLLFWIEPQQIELIFLLNIFIGISAGVVLPLILSMYGDIADYSEWKTGRRATGLIFSSLSMSQKLGWTLGGAITLWILAAYGFEANMEQSETSIRGIKMLMSFYPAIGAGISAMLVLVYKLNKKFMDKITTELNERREKNSH